MGSVVVVLGGVGVICASGFVVTTALKWFHSYEVDIESLKGNKKRDNAGRRKDVSSHDRVDAISKRLHSGN